MTASNEHHRTGLLCADNIGRNEGQVACHDLGLPDEYPSIRAVTAPSDAVFLGSNVRCQGNEVKLSDCRHDNWDTAACGSGEAAFVSCQSMGRVVFLFCSPMFFYYYYLFIYCLLLSMLTSLECLPRVWEARGSNPVKLYQ